MEEIPNNHLGYIEPRKYWDKVPTNLNWWSPDFWTINSVLFPRHFRRWCLFSQGGICDRSLEDKYILVYYTVMKVDGATPKHVVLVRCHDKPIHGSVAPSTLPGGITFVLKNSPLKKSEVGRVIPSFRVRSFRSAWCFFWGHRAFQHRGLSWHRSRGEAEMGFFCHFPDGSIKKGRVDFLEKIREGL